MNMTIEFDLQKAIAGARLVTRLGFPVTILTFSRRFRLYPIVGLVHYPDYDAVMTWTKEGRATKLLLRPHDNDLLICRDASENLDGDSVKREGGGSS